jgi:hypothetical protein
VDNVESALDEKQLSLQNFPKSSSNSNPANEFRELQKFHKHGSNLNQISATVWYKQYSHSIREIPCLPERDEVTEPCPSSLVLY